MRGCPLHQAIYPVFPTQTDWNNQTLKNFPATHICHLRFFLGRLRCCARLKGSALKGYRAKSLKPAECRTKVQPTNFGQTIHYENSNRAKTKTKTAKFLTGLGNRIRESWALKNFRLLWVNASGDCVDHRLWDDCTDPIPVKPLGG